MPGMKQIVQNNLIQRAERSYAQNLLLHRQAYKMWMYEREGKDADFALGETIANVKSGSGRMGAGSYQLLADTDFTGQMKLDQSKDYLILMNANGMPSADWEQRISASIKEKKAQILYGDEDYLSPLGRIAPWFKPDYSPDTIMGMQYFGSLTVIPMNLAVQCMESGYCRNADSSVNVYEMILWTTGHVPFDRIEHINRILFHRYLTEQDLEMILDEGEELDAFHLEEKLKKDRQIEGTESKYNDMKIRVLTSRMQSAVMRPDAYGCQHVQYFPDRKMGQNRSLTNYQWPLVTVIIPSKDHPELLLACIESLNSISNYPNLEIIVMDNGSTGRNRATIALMQQKYSFTTYYEPQEFNFSTMCNSGARKAKGDYLLFLNDDTTIQEPDSIQRMVGQASLDYTGAVGAKLLYPEAGGIQHAGVTNMETGPSHKLIGASDSFSYYYGRNRVDYNYLAVTAACMMVLKNRFWEVGGFDETLKIAYNDVEFCFKLYEKGYYNVMRNDAVFIHYESFSRGNDNETPEKWERLLCEREKLYRLHPKMYRNDPFYSVHLTGNLPEYVCRYVDLDDHKKVRFSEVSIQDANRMNLNETVQIQIDYAKTDQKMDLLNENSSYLIEGWCYLKGLDNCRYTIQVMLRNTESGKQYVGEVQKVVREDVTAILPGEKNIEMSGFQTRLERGTIPKGSYQVGILAKDRCSRQQLVNYSAQILETE